jgi:hypothetical protein
MSRQTQSTPTFAPVDASAVRDRMHRAPDPLDPGADLGIGPDLAAGQDLHRFGEVRATGQLEHPLAAHPAQHFPDLAGTHQRPFHFTEPSQLSTSLLPTSYLTTSDTTRMVVV